MIALKDGRDQLYQWDTGVELIVDEKIQQVHFSRSHYKQPYNVEVIDGAVRIPDELLQGSGVLYCWLVMYDNFGSRTIIEHRLSIIRRAKPSDYIYTPTQQATVAGLRKDVNYLLSFIENSTSGCKGYYIKSIDLTNKKIYLCNEKVRPIIGVVDNTDNNFETPAYKVDSGFNIINLNHYILRATIKSIVNNVVIYEGDLGFTQIYDDDGIDGYTFSVPSQPEIGVVDIADGAIAYGYGSKASASNTFVAGEECLGAGANGAVFGAGNTGGYGSLVSGQNNYSPAQSGTTGGADNYNTGFCTDVHGRWLLGKGAAQCVRGIYNIADKLSKFLLIIGNGKSDTERDNAFTIGRDNNAYHRGDVYVHTTFDENGVKSTGDKLATVLEVKNDVTSLETKISNDLNLKAPLYKGLQISNRVHSAGGIPTSISIEVKTEENSKIVYEHITPKNVNEAIYVSNYSISPRVTTNNGKLYFKLLMRTNQVVKSNISLMGMYDANGNSVSGSIRGIESVTSGKGVWEQLVIPVEGLPKNAVDFKHIYLYFAGIGAVGSDFNSDAYFDIAGWAVFDDLNRAIAYDLTVDASDIFDNGYNIQGQIDALSSRLAVLEAALKK